MEVTLTSEWNLVIAEFSGVQADVYSPDLLHLYDVSLTGAQSLRGVTSQGEAVFVVDYTARGIHVVLNDGRTYSHMIPVSFKPTYAQIFNYSLYLPDYIDNNIYKLVLDSAYNDVSIVTIISSSLSGPENIYIDSDIIAVSNYFSRRLTVFHNDGKYNLEWEYVLGGIHMVSPGSAVEDTLYSITM
jgi:hypothetical protein